MQNLNQNLPPGAPRIPAHNMLHDDNNSDSIDTPPVVGARQDTGDATMASLPPVALMKSVPALAIA